MVIGDNDPPYPLTPHRLQVLVESGAIDFPATTHMEIADKSKSDVLSKGLVVVQTGWFILQIIARGVQRLPVTGLEVVTVAFSVLNFFTYIMWFGKPLHVRCSIPVFSKPIPEIKNGGENEAENGGKNGDKNGGKSECESEGEGEGESGGQEARHESGMHLASAMIRRVVKPIEGFLRDIEKLDTRRTGILGAIKGMAWAVIKNGVLLPIPKLIVVGFDMGLSEPGSTDPPINQKIVPIFYAGTLTDFQGLCAALASAMVATAFGCVHCVAWSFSFPSRAEKMLWRASSVVIACIPPFYLLLFGIVSLSFSRGLTTPPWLKKWFEKGFRIVVLSCTFLYVLARLTLLVLPFTSLRSLPHGALQTVAWTTFIPHI